MKNFFLLVLIAIVLCSSCASRKDLVYLQSNDSTQYRNYENTYITFKPGDILTISFLSEDERATSPLNPVGTYFLGSSNPNSPFLPTYTIDSEGFINLPKLGLVNVEGLTRLQTIEKLETLATQYIQKPFVSIKLQNFRVTVLGEVKSPGVYYMEHDRITILEALGLAGDLNVGAVRKNVLLIREDKGNKTEYRLDLTDSQLLNSPIYYLAQNDVIYVEPNKATIQSASYSRNTSIFISIAGLALTIITLLTR